MDKLNHVVLDNGAESYVSKVCRRTFRYIYMRVSQFNSCAEDLEMSLKSWNFICLESVNPDDSLSENVSFLLAEITCCSPALSVLLQSLHESHAEPPV